MFKVFAIFIIFASVKPAHMLTQLEMTDKKLIEHISSMCQFRTNSTAAFDKLSMSSMMFRGKFLSQNSSVYVSQDDYCPSDRKREAEEELKKATDNLRECLEPQDKYLADFLRDSFTGVLNFLCENYEEHFKDFYYAANCLSHSSNDVGECVTRCFNHVTGTPTKPQLCEDLTQLENCFAEILTRKCPSYVSFNEEVFHYVREPCSGCTFFMNTVLLIASVIFSNFFNNFL